METRAETRRHFAKTVCWYHALIPCAVCLLTLLPFLPSLQNGFVDWDDYDNFLNNPSYRGLSWSHLKWMFVTFHMFNYRPLTWVTFGFDYTLWGMNPFGYHLTSLILHAASALIVYFLAARLLSLTRPQSTTPNDMAVKIAAAFSTLLFSIHPLRVEPVAWLSARSHLLSSLFFLLTLACYLRATASSKRNWSRWCWLSGGWILYSLSILSQPSGVTLPVILIILDVYPLGRLGGGTGKWFGREARPVWWEKMPFLVLALVGGLIGLIVKQAVVLSSVNIGPLSRLAELLYALAIYGWRTVVPIGLSPLYQLPAHFSPWDWPFLLGGGVVLAVTTVVFVVRRRWPAGLACWSFYLAILIPYVGFMLPVLGDVKNGPQVTADRYSYIASLPWCVLAGAGALAGWQWLRRRGLMTAILASTPVVVALAALIILTWQQTQVWHDTYSLWRHAVEATDRSHFKSLGAHYNLANSLRKQGKLKEAAQHYRFALSRNPAFSEAHNNLGLALAGENDIAGAREQFEEAIKLDPKNSEARANLGNVLAMQGDLTGAIRDYRDALKVSPNLHGARFQMAILLAKLNQLDEAKGEFQEYLKKQPDSVDAHYFLGTIYFAQKDFPKGMEEMRKALKLRPDFADAHITLARALRLQGKLDEASQHYQRALGILKAQREIQNLR
jgi:protein O-mannosyl-transferase